MPYYGNDNDLYMKTLHVSINFKYSITLLQKILWDWDHQILLCPFHIFRPKKKIFVISTTKKLKIGRKNSNFWTQKTCSKNLGAKLASLFFEAGKLKYVGQDQSEKILSFISA